jgi:hypothetical protein
MERYADPDIPSIGVASAPVRNGHASASLACASAVSVPVLE